MEIAITLATVARGLIFAVLSIIVACTILWPINDRPTSRTQIAVFLLVEVVLIVLISGHLSFKFTT